MNRPSSRSPLLRKCPSSVSAKASSGGPSTTGVIPRVPTNENGMKGNRSPRRKGTTHSPAVQGVAATSRTSAESATFHSRTR